MKLAMFDRIDVFPRSNFRMSLIIDNTYDLTLAVVSDLFLARLDQFLRHVL